MNSKNLVMAACITLASFAAQSTLAAPVAYTFTTGANPVATGAMGGYFGPGTSVSGSFYYDSATPATVTIAGVTFYDFAVTNMVGAVGGFSFSDLAGGSISANDAAATGGDFFNVGCCRNLLPGETTVPTSVAPYDLHGFSLGGNALTHASIAWSEVLGSADFLTSNGLLAELPTASGRFTFQFGAAGTIVFDGAVVRRVPVPEPSTLLLLGIAFTGVALTRRRRTPATLATTR